jgi:hypothetical protein
MRPAAPVVVHQQLKLVFVVDETGKLALDEIDPGLEFQGTVQWEKAHVLAVDVQAGAGWTGDFQGRCRCRRGHQGRHGDDDQDGNGDPTEHGSPARKFRGRPMTLVGASIG